ncbi:Uncharacterised protein [Legionella israelensis]|nr:hypothetical protein SAMN02746069_01397 [Legionella israelensis DSM 19235]STX59379.1 Uncharacterised protein [Legionella israelensis]
MDSSEQVDFPGAPLLFFHFSLIVSLRNYLKAAEDIHTHKPGKT